MLAHANYTQPRPQKEVTLLADVWDERVRDYELYRSSLMMRSLTPLIFRHLPILSNATHKPLGAISIRFDRHTTRAHLISNLAMLYKLTATTIGSTIDMRFVLTNAWVEPCLGFRSTPLHVHRTTPIHLLARRGGLVQRQQSTAQSMGLHFR